MEYPESTNAIAAYVGLKALSYFTLLVLVVALLYTASMALRYWNLIGV